jgi:hypothetical protein
MWKEATAMYFEEISWHLLGATPEKQKITQCGLWTEI